MPKSLDPGLNEIAAALAALRPSPPALDRDRLLFRAGRASAPRPWLWPLSAAVSTTVAMVLAAMLAFRPAPLPVEHVVYVQVQAAQPTPPKAEAPPPAQEDEPSPDSWATTPYTRLEDRLLRWGFDGLAEPTPPAAPPDTRDSLLRSL